MAKDKTIIDLMVEPGPLEMQAHFAVASLRSLDPQAFEIALHCRADRTEGFAPLTYDLFQSQGLSVRPMNNPFSDGYGAGNKLAVAAIEKDCDWRLTLDTDIFLCAPFDVSAICRAGHVSAVPSYYRSYNHPPQAWLTAYAHYGLPLPPADMNMGNGKPYLPYFNAGFVLTPNGFGTNWLRVAQQLDKMPSVPEKRPWLDQISLPVAIAVFADGYNILPESYNNSPNRKSADTVLYHYHRLRGLKRNKWIFKLIDAALERSGAPERSAKSVISYYLDRDDGFRAQALKMDQNVDRDG